MISTLFTVMLTFAPATPSQAPGVTPQTGGQALRHFITQCEQRGGIAVVTVNKRDAIAMGCVRAAWETVEMPE